MQKRLIIGTLAVSMLCSGCATSGYGGANAVFAGAAIGNNVGSAIGGIIGDNRGGWRGSYRGSAIGSLIGTIAGAALGGVISNASQPKGHQDEEYGYPVESQGGSYYPDEAPAQRNYAPSQSTGIENLSIHNIRFIDDTRDHVIESGESSRVIFEIINNSNETVYGIVPIVKTDMKKVYVSPSIMVEQILPHNGIKYTANIKAGKRIKEDKITIHIAVADENGQEYDWQEFSLPTRR